MKERVAPGASEFGTIPACTGASFYSASHQATTEVTKQLSKSPNNYPSHQATIERPGRPLCPARACALRSDRKLDKEVGWVKQDQTMWSNVDAIIVGQILVKVVNRGCDQCDGAPCCQTGRVGPPSRLGRGALLAACQRPVVRPWRETGLASPADSDEPAAAEAQ